MIGSYSESSSDEPKSLFATEHLPSIAWPKSISNQEYEPALVITVYAVLVTDSCTSDDFVVGSVRWRLARTASCLRPGA